MITSSHTSCMWYLYNIFMHDTIYYPIQNLYASQKQTCCPTAHFFTILKKRTKWTSNNYLRLFLKISGLATHQLLSLSSTTNCYEELITASNLTVTEVTSGGEKRGDVCWGFWKMWCSPSKVEFYTIYNPYIYYIYVLNYLYMFWFFVYVLNSFIYPLCNIISQKRFLII